MLHNASVWWSFLFPIISFFSMLYVFLSSLCFFTGASRGSDFSDCTCSAENETLCYCWVEAALMAPVWHLVRVSVLVPVQMQQVDVVLMLCEALWNKLLVKNGLYKPDCLALPCKISLACLVGIQGKTHLLAGCSGCFFMVKCSEFSSDASSFSRIKVYFEGAEGNQFPDASSGRFGRIWTRPVGLVFFPVIDWLEAMVRFLRQHVTDNAGIFELH